MSKRFFLKTIYTVLVVAGLGLLPGMAAASEAGMPPDVAGYDINGDGRITMPEIMQHIQPSVQKGFDVLDRNKDGVLSKDDFNDVSQGMQQMQDWLEELLRPFMPSEDLPSDNREPEDSDHKTQVF